jgi:GNAT superfamily N-acetyltransferase
MIAGLRIRSLAPDDAETISAAFAALGWKTSRAQYEAYLGEQDRGERDVLVAEVVGEFAGHLAIKWCSEYAPFFAAEIPEIKNLAVLPSWRRRGIASALMDEAEELVATRREIVGIGVGMDPDYGPAQRMYALRGYVPDARGLTSHNVHVRWGDTVTVDDDLVLYATKRLRPG